MDMRRAKGKHDGAVVLSVSGMTCNGCVNTVKRVMSRVPGITSAEVDLGSGRATVMGAPHPEDLIAAIQAAGYGARLSQDDTTAGERNERGRSDCC